MLKNNDKSIYWAIIIVAIVAIIILISLSINGVLWNPSDFIIFIFSLVTIFICFIFVIIKDPLEANRFKSYAVKKNSAKKIVDAMLSWKKLFSNPDYKIFYVVISLYIKNGVYNLVAGVSEKEFSSDYEIFNIKIEKKELRLVIKEVSSVINEIHKFSILIEQKNHATQEIKLLDEIDLEKFMSWLENTFNKYNIKYFIQDDRIDSQKINGMEQQDVYKQELSDDSLEKRLIHLKELLDKGLINKKDYETQKREIIKNI